jgi:hypothetical protein
MYVVAMTETFPQPFRFSCHVMIPIQSHLSYYFLLIFDSIRGLWNVLSFTRFTTILSQRFRSVFSFPRLNFIIFQSLLCSALQEFQISKGKISTQKVVELSCLKYFCNKHSLLIKNHN